MRKLALIMLLGYCFPAIAQEDRSNQLMKSIYSKLEEVLGVNDYQAARRANLLVIAAPGLQVDEKLNPSKPEDRKKIVELMDIVPQSSWVYRASALAVSDVYQAILDNHEAALTSLTTAQQKQLSSAQSIIYKNKKNAEYSDAYKRYSAARTALATALGNLQDFQRANPDLAPPAALSDALAQARDNFDLIGDKNTIIAAKATIDNLENLDPAVFWGKLRERYNSNTFPVGVAQVPVYDLLPGYQSWTDKSQSWGSYKLTDSDIESHSSSSHTSISGGIGGGWGLFSFGGGYGHSETSTHVSVDGKNFSLEFELLRVAIIRPWLDGAVFRSQTWQWQPGSNYAGKLISDGADVDSAVTPKGLMPLLPTELILARNVKLTANWSTDIKNTFEQSTTSTVRAGWGPFSGSYSRTDTSSSADSSVKVSGNTVTFEKPQIIGYLVEVVPGSPIVKPGLKFASDKPTNVGPLVLESAVRRLFDAKQNEDARLLKQSNSALKRNK